MERIIYPEYFRCFEYPEKKYMAIYKQISALFLDIGGVLLTNGLDRNTRIKATEYFHLAYNEFDERHQMTFDA